MNATSVCGRPIIAYLSGLVTKLRTQKNLADAAVTFSVRVLSALLAFGVQVFLARTLDLGEYGIYATLWTWLIVLNHIAAFGFSESAIRFLPRYAHRGKHHWAGGFLSTGYKVVTFGAVTIAALGIAILSLIGESLPPAYVYPVLILFVGLPFTALELYLEGVSRSFGWFLLTIVPAYILRPLAIAAGVLICLAGGYKPDATIVLGLAVLITATIVLVQSLIIRSRIRKKFDEPRTSGVRKVWLIASLPLILTLTVDEIFTWSDILILGFMTSPEQISVYFAAQRSMSLAAFVHFAFMLVMVRDFSIAKSARNKTELQRQVTRASNWTFWLTVPSTALTLAVGYPLLWMFGPEFLAGYSVMILLGVAYIARAAAGQAPDLLVVLGHQRACVVISTGCILLNIFFSILLIPQFGIAGAALATAMTYSARSIAFAIAAYKLEGLRVLAGIPRLSHNSGPIPAMPSPKGS